VCKIIWSGFKQTSPTQANTVMYAPWVNALNGVTNPFNFVAYFHGVSWGSIPVE
jgi:hypothetical protein